MTGLRRFWWATVSGGRFFGRWSVIGTLPLALTAMGAYLGPLAPDSLLPAAVASAAAWVICVLLCLIPAILERRIPSRAGRGAVVLSGIVMVAAIRPFLLDAMLMQWGSVSAPNEWMPFRVVTNILVWAVVLSALAVASASVRALRLTNARLAAVEEQMRRDGDLQRIQDAHARALVTRCAEELRVFADGPLRDPAAIARFAAGPVRENAHRLAALAQKQPPEVEAAVDAPHGMSLRRFRLPAIGAVAAVYLVLMLPYTVRALGPQVALAAVVLTALCGAMIDLVPRARPRMPMRVRSAVFLLLSVIAGAVSSSALAASGAVPARFVSVPAVTIPLIALGTGWCAGLLHGMRAEGRRLETSIGERRRTFVGGAGARKRALEEASRLMHRDVQGACVLYGAASATDPAGRDAASRVLRESVGAASAALRLVFERAGEDADAPAELADVLAAWGRVVEVRQRIDPACTAVFDADPPLARQVLDVVAEGMVNAVKHGVGGPITVDVRVLATGAGPVTAVEVSAPGALDAGAELRPDSPAGLLGAILTQRGADVVLSARLRASAVVPTAHFSAQGVASR
ncbi:hypothetical protein [Microbacterium sp. NPDC057944]|uniref:hypothetical protein n=1 Tax=Microbacterium sp. NPDC057944 TaxID=3346286 RepID=UPI0036DB0A07